MLSRPLGRPNTHAILLQHQPEQIIQSLLQTRFLTVGAAVDNAMEIHDRRPVVLSPEIAREWLSPDLMKDRAKEIAHDCGQPAEDFEWYPVSKDVGNVRNKGEYLIKSIT